MKGLSELRADALEIFRAGVRAVDPEAAIQNLLKVEDNRLEIPGQRYDLSLYDGIYVVGGGKAGGKMARAIESILGDRLKAGVVNVKYGCSVDLDLIRINEAGHPLPDEMGVRGTKEMMELLGRTGEKDLVLCLLSGGGSALMPAPAEGVTLQEKQQTTQLLLQCGATIHEINAVRKHLSKIKGGRLAKLAYPSTVISLILSDVVGDDLDVIASGPTVPDKSTFADAIRVLQKYGIYGKVPAGVRGFLEKGAQGDVIETPKARDPVFQRVKNLLVGNNRLALGAAKKKGRQTRIS